MKFQLTAAISAVLATLSAAAPRADLKECEGTRRRSSLKFIPMKLCQCDICHAPDASQRTILVAKID